MFEDEEDENESDEDESKLNRNDIDNDNDNDNDSNEPILKEKRKEFEDVWIIIFLKQLFNVFFK